MPSLHDLRIGESLLLAGQGQVRVTLRAKSGRLARLEIAADDEVAILVADKTETMTVDAIKLPGTVMTNHKRSSV